MLSRRKILSLIGLAPVAAPLAAAAAQPAPTSLSSGVLGIARSGPYFTGGVVREGAVFSAGLRPDEVPVILRRPNMHRAMVACVDRIVDERIAEDYPMSSPVDGFLPL